MLFWGKDDRNSSSQEIFQEKNEQEYREHKRFDSDSRVYFSVCMSVITGKLPGVML